MSESYADLSKAFDQLTTQHSDLIHAFAHYHVNNPDEELDPCRECGLDLRHKIHHEASVESRRRWGKPTMII